MFTGIVEEIGIVKNVSADKLTVKASKVLEGTKSGDSIAVNGACLTITAIEKDTFSVEIMPETIRRTSIGKMHYGDSVNLERAMSALGHFGGHFVQGHIDDTGKVIGVTIEGNAVMVKITAPSQVMRYIVEKGFVAVDGVSLTVIECDDFAFSVSLVGFTRKQTMLGKIKQGSIVNLEIDIIAKYVERFSRARDNKTVADFIQDYDLSKTE